MKLPDACPRIRVRFSRSPSLKAKRPKGQKADNTAVSNPQCQQRETGQIFAGAMDCNRHHTPFRSLDRTGRYDTSGKLLFGRFPEHQARLPLGVFNRFFTHLRVTGRDPFMEQVKG